MQPGIYFGIPEDEYHAIEAVGSSALRDILISPLDAWVRHVNPERDQKKDTAATLRGTAFHAALLEGIDALQSRFYPKLNKEAFPDVLWSGDQLAAECAERGVAKGGTLMDRCERLSAAGVPASRLGAMIEADYEATHEGKQQLPAEDWDRIIAAHAVMDEAGIAKAFAGGQPEVSIVYECEITGMLRKARIDYLKPAAAFDLKTFANVTGKELETAVHHAFIFNRQHVQAVDYWLAIEQAKKQRLPMQGGKIDLAREPHDYFMVYLQSGEVPNVAVRRVARKSQGATNAYWKAAEDDRARALRQYARCMQTFGADRPWVDPVKIDDFEDTLFPGYLIGA